MKSHKQFYLVGRNEANADSEAP